MNLLNFQKKFVDEQACIDWLINERFGSKENIECPHCNCKKAYKFKNGKTTINPRIDTSSLILLLNKN